MQEQHMQVAIKDILPNPFRQIENYPIKREKVETLKTSFEKTDFWDNIVGRARKDGKVELAYGHHRWVALKEKYGPNHKVNIIIRDLDDATMIQIMANENMEDWGTSAIVEIETIESVVRAFGEGKIRLPKAHPSGMNLRCAPSFIPANSTTRGVQADKIYNNQSIGEFLGWVHSDGKAKNKIGTALTALQYIEEGIIKLKAFDGISSSGIAAVVKEASQARAYKESEAKAAARRAQLAKEEAEEAKQREEEAEKEAEKYRRRQQAEEEKRAREEAKEAARQRDEAIKAKARAEAEAKARRKEGQENARKVTEAVSKHLREGGGVRSAPDAAIKAVPMKERKQVQIEEYLRKALHKVGTFLFANEPVGGQLQAVLEYKDDIDPDLLEDARKTLLSLSDRARNWADDFQPTQRQPNNAKPGRLALKH